MSFYSNAISMLSAATYAAQTASKGFDVSEYRDGTLIFHVRTLVGTGARVYPLWSISPDATGARSGRYWAARAFATSLRATGLAAITLPGFLVGKWCRVSFTLGGTSPSTKLAAWAVLKGQQ